MDINEIFDSKWSYLSTWNDWNSDPHKTHIIGHSKDTDAFIYLLDKARELRTGIKQGNHHLQ